MDWFKTRTNKGKVEIFDPLRKKYVSLTPEEEVRQLVLQKLVEELNYPAGLIAVEYSFKLHKVLKRSDIVVFSRTGTPRMLIECKARHIPLTQATLDQAIRYNMKLQVGFLVLTNAITTHIILLDLETTNFRLLNYFPSYNELLEPNNQLLK